MTTETYVICEGYHDRAFWAGWLHLGCRDPGLRDSGQRKPILDPWGRTVKGGQFAFQSTRGHFVRVVPAGGKERVFERLRVRLSERTTEPVRRLVVNIDPDTPSEGGAVRTGLRLADVESMLRSEDPNASTRGTAVEIDGGATTIHLVRWEVPALLGMGVPAIQTLERLVCAAIVAAFPARGEAVQKWLDGRPDRPAPDAKEHAWSYMAGWYAESGCERFYSGLWEVDPVRAELQRLLGQSGAWSTVQSLLAD